MTVYIKKSINKEKTFIIKLNKKNMSKYAKNYLNSLYY